MLVMSVFSQPDFDNHEQIIFGSDGESGLRCIVAIHDRRADELAADGDMEGRAAWLRIVKAVEELLSEERPDDVEVH